MKRTEKETISGAIEEIVYRNEETGFTVMAVAYEEELLTIVGVFADIVVGEEIRATGSFTFHPTYGRQFKADFIERELPSTAAATFKYLASGVIKGIGPATAKKIVEKFGDNTISILENDPEALCQIRGISPEKAHKIGEEFQRLFGIRTVMLHLSRFGIVSGTAVSVWKKWGMQSVTIIQDNPYMLCNEDIGMDFSSADSIAMGIDLPLNSRCRMEGAILHVLRVNMMNGHCCVPLEKLVQKSAQLLEIQQEEIEHIIETMLADHDLESFTQNLQYIYLPKLYEAETFIAGRLGMMLLLSYDHEKDREEKITALEERLQIHYAQAQREAISAALTKGIMILTGGPGTGKTTTLNGIITLLEEEKYKVALAAPTGRAAKRMSEVTGREAKTIHRLLEVDFRNDNNMNVFKRNQKNPLPFDAIIIDEISMVEVTLFESLLKALRMGCKLILVGDSDQLPPVGAGNVLKDLCDSGTITRVHLTEIFRQAAQSLIVTNAHRIVHGENPELALRDNDFFFLPQRSMDSAGTVVCDLVSTRLPKTYHFSPLWDIQVICASRNGILGTNELNLALQQRLNPPAQQKGEYKTAFFLFREGDKVMQSKNNYNIVWTKHEEEGAGIFNGDIGIIEMIDRASKTILVNFSDRVAQYSFEIADELELAYAITVHKSQGNEFDAVIIPLMGSHSKLHYRNLLYTAVTRAKKLLILAGSSQTIYQMVSNNRKTLRYTNLATFLKEVTAGASSRGEQSSIFDLSQPLCDM